MALRQYTWEAVLMSTDGKNWEDLFRERALGLGQQIDISPMEEGMVAFQEARKCTNCDSSGVYSGIGLFNGRLFQSVNADFCPKCKHVRTISTSRPLISSNPARFLPVMEKRLMEYPNLIAETTDGDPCPECQAPTHVLEVTKGMINNFGHRWRVCIAGCGWSGLYEPVIK